MDRREDSIDANDLRNTERYIAEPPIAGTFAAIEISVSNLAETGIQAEHARPMRIGMAGRLTLRVEGPRVSVPATVVWSRLSDRTDSKGKFLYRSGIRFEQEDDAARQLLQSLVDKRRIRVDEASLQRKKEMLAVKAKALASQPKMKAVAVASNVSADVLLLVQQARERLQTHPGEAAKWYNRARYTIAEVGAQSIQYREDVVAIWESLERTIDLDTISQALSQLKK